MHYIYTLYKCNFFISEQRSFFMKKHLICIGALLCATTVYVTAMNQRSGFDYFYWHIKDRTPLQKIIFILNNPTKQDNFNGGVDKIPLIAAVEEDYTDALEVLLKYGVNINHQTAFVGTTALQRAAEQNKLEFVLTLLSNGANPNIENNEGKTALDLATNQGVIDLLISKGGKKGSGISKMDKFTARQKLEKDPRLQELRQSLEGKLYNAANNNNSPEAERLLKLGVNPNGEDRSGYVPLIIAVVRNNPNMMQLLLDNGANINHQDYDNGNTALHRATEDNKTEIIQLLKDRGARTNIRNSRGKTVEDLEKAPKEIPVESKSKKSTFDLDALPESFKSEESSQKEIPSKTTKGALYAAVRAEKLEKVQELLSQGANPNGDDDFGIPLMMALIKNTPGMLQLLLEKGADINKKTTFGTPFQEAAQGDYPKVVEVMLKYNPDLAVKNLFGRTALDLAKKTNKAKNVELITEYMNSKK